MPAQNESPPESATSVQSPAAAAAVAHGAPTPLFDDTVAALHGSAETTRESSHGPDAGVWVVAPDSAGGAAIIDLFARIKKSEGGQGQWGSDCLGQLELWLIDVGIDPKGTLDDAVHAMRTASESHAAMRVPGFVVRVTSDHADAATVITTALTVLTRQLGDNAAAVLSTRDGDVLARFGELNLPSTATPDT